MPNANRALAPVLTAMAIAAGCTPLAEAPDDGMDAGEGFDGQVDVPDGCAPVAETCNGDDDDCDGLVDEGFDLQTDAAHCGACDAACSYANASGVCAGGACSLGECDASFGDCDADPDNGCEAAVTDPSRCGDCETECPAGWFCVAGDPPRCEDTCATRCGGDCTDTMTSRDHCGGCDSPCDLANGSEVCVGGECLIDDCAAGFADCDDDATNGCEAALDRPESCDRCDVACDPGERCETGGCTCGGAVSSEGPACGDGEGCCGDTCVSLLDNPTHCGACDAACSGAGALCCGTSCVDRRTDESHCGSCDNDCSGATATCCDSGCVDTETDANHCGGCGQACRPGETCVSGGCTCGGGPRCNPGEDCVSGSCDCAGMGPCTGASPGCCDGSCFDLWDDANVTHCTGCNIACGPNEHCGSNPAGEHGCECGEEFPGGSGTLRVGRPACTGGEVCNGTRCE